LVELPQECLVVFYLTVRNKTLARDTVSLGTATASLVHPREVFRPAIQHNASHIVLAHNHPSGDPSPSQADKTVTRAMARAGHYLGIELLDHVICSKEGHVSLKSTSPNLFIPDNF
jgi:DNA repair protein RadC